VLGGFANFASRISHFLSAEKFNGSVAAFGKYLKYFQQPAAVPLQNYAMV